MKRILSTLLAIGALTANVRAADTLPPASERFAKDTAETPDFRRHVLPLMGRLGCNGRACHGSFQGQGGFRLSLFGYDFAADHEALLAGDPARVNNKAPAESLIIRKPTLTEDHEGGKRFELGSWQHRLLARWIESGAAPVSPEGPEFRRLEITPSQVSFAKTGDTAQLRIVAHWADGSQEDVTPLCRFRTNDESIAEVDENGLVKSLTPGDTHIVAFYDNGVQPVPALLPVSALAGANYPTTPTPSKIDELVVAKLRQLGVVPAELSGDSEFLRRVSLDMTGTLPTPTEIDTFVADGSSDKRTKKIDELLSRPSYVAWWTTRLCDYTGANAQALNEGPFDGGRTARQWYQWIYRRVEQNMPYDQIVSGLVLSKGRAEGQSYDEYCQQMTGYLTEDNSSNFAARETMPHYWMRRDGRKPEEMAQRFAYSFLGVRLQCAQCHKHPFDQWTKHDFDQFTSFFRRISFGVAPDGRERSNELRKELQKAAGAKVDLKKDLNSLVSAGKEIPWPEVFVSPKGKGGGGDKMAAKPKKGKKNKNTNDKSPPATSGRLLNGENVDLGESEDPRRELVEWMRRDAEGALAKALVNRVWSAYFNVGIIEPPDDLNMANPPSNEPLLAWLTHEFVAHNFDLKWLHREIAGSRTYQLSCATNETNRLDTRNFSHASPRRLPAEVAYNAILQATARNQDLTQLQNDPDLLATGAPQTGAGKKNGKGKNQASYALTVFGKPTRKTNCDCERTSEPTLLQTLFLRNDQEMLSLIERPDGWLSQLSASTKVKDSEIKYGELDERRQAQTATAAELRAELESSDKAGGKKVASLRKRLAQLEKEVASLTDQQLKLAARIETADAAGSLDDAELVRQAYLRTLSRLPGPDELARAEQYLGAADDAESGKAIRDLVWALLNTKEFILNH